MCYSNERLLGGGMIMSEHWDMYLGYIDDQLASVVLDMAIWQEIDTEKFNHCYCLRLKLTRWAYS